MLLRLLLLLLIASGLNAQIVITDPAAPVADQPVTITFDATQGTAGLQDCGCDVYIHTGLITPASADGGDWQNVVTTWGETNEDWKMEAVDGEENLYTYTIGPDIRSYYGADATTEIQQLAFVFRNGDGSQEGKATGGGNIFIDVNSGTGLAVNLQGQPGSDTYALGRRLPIRVGATNESTLELFDNDSLLISATGDELTYDVRLTESGDHIIRIEATADGQTVADSFTVVGALAIDRTMPATSVVSAEAGETVDLSAVSYVEADLRILAGDDVVISTVDTAVSTTVTLPEGEVITYTFEVSYRGEVATTTATFITGAPREEEVPDGFQPGVTVMENGNLIFVLRAPLKQDVFVVGNFNDWSATAGSRMVRSPNDTTFWLELPATALPGCGGGEDCRSDLLYQYAIDGDGRFADPYSTLVLDANDDPFIGEEVFAGIPSYPTEETDGIVSWLRYGNDAYEWQTEDYDRPDPERMVIYELLVRDFLDDHSFTSLTDSLDYFERLGINTIELMPVSEFEGNISWGYNPSFHMALDKYYGSPEDLKAFVDAAHERGIAVVLDVVYNHAFGESPLVRMWPGAEEFNPGPDNPYANVEARHPFNVGTDLNHESLLTQEYVRVTLAYWLEEFRVDGFRFDLSKGFTQRQSDDVAEWNAYDAERVAIIKDYADLVWSVDSAAYMIMEHLGDPREENELAQYGKGMYFWSGFQPHDAYLEASMGYHDDGKSNFDEVLAENRGFDQRSLVGYMESHDEERMMFKNLSFGNEAGDYSTKDLSTALDRVELASTFFYTLPGPKMLWQFGELGYDFSINYCGGDRIDESCRTDPKPITWEYREEADRQDVYETISDLLFLRNNYELFHGEVTSSDLADSVKTIQLDSEDGQVAIVGNFGVTAVRVGNFVPAAGDWYDYFNETTVNISDPSALIDLAPGEYRLYLSREIAPGGGELSTSTNDVAVARLAFTVRPNPATDRLTAEFTLESASRVDITLFDISGRAVRNAFSGNLPAGPQQRELDVADLAPGTYFLRISDATGAAVRRIVVR